MNVYKGMWFCTFYEDCEDGKNCYRALTKQIYEKAKEAHLPIQTTGKPNCYKGEDHESN